MVSPLAIAEVVELLVPAMTTLGGVSVAGYLVHRFTQRRTAEARYDDAISAVARLQAARHAGNVKVPGKYVQAEGEQLAQIEQQLSVETVRQFMDAAADARAALAALYAYSPDLRRFWDKLELPQHELDEVTALLMERRRKPTKVHPAPPALSSSGGS